MARSIPSSATLTPQEQRARLLHLLAQKEQVTKFAPLSFSQERFWLEEQLAPGSINSLSLSVRITGQLSVTALEQSFTEIVRRHEVLRTSFVVVNDQPRQAIKPPQPAHLPIISLEHLPVTEREAAAQSAARAELNRPFDITQGPLFRASLLRLDSADHVLILITQHLISDAWSLGILIHEVSILYDAFTKGQTSPLPPLPWQYADFAQWQREKMQDAALEHELAYWIKQISKNTALLDIPTDRPRLFASTISGARESFSLSLALREQLKALAQQTGCTLFMVLLTALQILLQRYTRQNEINIYTLVANRTVNAAEQLVGLFLNTLLLCADLGGNPTFLEALQQARQVTLEAYDHQTIPFQKLMEASQLQSGLDRMAPFQVLLILQNLPNPDIQLSDLVCQRFMREMDFQSDMELSFSIQEVPEGLTGFLEYRTELYDPATIQRLLGHYQALLQSIVDHPEQRIIELPLMSGGERERLLVDWNATQRAYPHDRSLAELFEEQVARTPEAVAVVWNQQHLTYQALNQRANQLARCLQSRDVGPGTLVGLCLERSLDLIVSLWGILKAGGAYVPLDPTYTAQRLDFIVEDTRIKLLLSHSALVPLLAASQAPVLLIDQTPELAAQTVDNLADVIHWPNELVYIIYTSGSTGQPKGVMIPQRALVQYATAAIQHFALTPADGVLQFASISFDAAAEEIYPTLLCGARLILRTEPMLDSPQTFWQTCATYGLSVLDLPTAFWHTLVAQEETVGQDLPDDLRLIILGGEAAQPDMVARWFELAPSRVRLVNTYGPTETTIVATLSNLTPHAAQAPIGRPITNTQGYVLDVGLQPAPIGVPGELYIGGAGLAHGYLQRPELTAAAFIPDPFGQVPGARLYKTGDLVRYLPDGQLQFMGRVDQQVKVRGFRVELREIEAVLQQQPAIREALVVVHQIADDKRLVAYLVPRTTPLDMTELRRNLLTRLPEYMVPAAFVVLDALPLTTSGKVDRRALPAPDFSAPRQNYAPPETPVEEKLIKLWAEVLPAKQIGIHDNFFEVGGHSLLAAQIIHRINRTFQLDLPMRSLFEEPTVAGLGLLIEERLLEEVSNQTPGALIHA
ncbi:enterobactin synthetase component F [Thermoflexales bacterium]|nr:enterobactin synthetase component F [Thermoflexales bacterium]